MFWFFAGWIVSNYYEQIKNMNRLLLRISILLWITCVCFEFPFKQTLLYICLLYTSPSPRDTR